MTIFPHQMPAHRAVPEPELSFHPDRQQDRHVHPLLGLVQFGPLSRSLVAGVLDPLRVAAIAPFGELGRVASLLSELDLHHQPRERRQYLIEYPGFARVFGIRLVLAPGAAQIQLPGGLDTELQSSDRPHLLLAERIVQAISAAQPHRSEFDILVILLPERWQDWFCGGPQEDFDLHDYLKAVTAVRGVPMQIVLESRALTYPCRCSVAWRLSIALYCKAGGVPWKLAQTDSETAYVGLSYAVRPIAAGAPRFVTCCSQVFDSDGVGLEFILYETDDVRVERDNPFLSRPEMRRVMARSLALFQRRHAGRPPKHVVVHKSTAFTPDEVEGCFDAWRVSDGLDLIHVQQDVTWRGIDIRPPRAGSGGKGAPGQYPCLRGTYLQLGGRDVLLWTQGNAPSAVGGSNYYKEGKGIPTPLLLTRYAGHGGWESTCQGVLGLSKMNWNNDGLYDRLPVTMGYAQVLARTVKRMSDLAARPYQIRFFM